MFYAVQHALRARAARRADATLAPNGIDTDFTIFQVFAGGPSRNLRSRFTTVKFLARNFLFFAKFCEAKRREKFRQVRDLCATLRAKVATVARPWRARTAPGRPMKSPGKLVLKKPDFFILVAISGCAPSGAATRLVFAPARKTPLLGNFFADHVGTLAGQGGYPSQSARKCFRG